MRRLPNEHAAALVHLDDAVGDRLIAAGRVFRDIAAGPQERAVPLSDRHPAFVVAERPGDLDQLSAAFTGSA